MEQLLKHINKVHLTVPEALTLLLIHYDANYNDTLTLLQTKGLIKKSENLFKASQYEITESAEDIVKLLLTTKKQSSNKFIIPSSISSQLENVATMMKMAYPKGHRENSSKPYAPSVKIIEERLRKLITLYHSSYDPNIYYLATLYYLYDTKKKNPSLKYLMDLDYFILKKDNEGVFRSHLLNIIEEKKLWDSSITLPFKINNNIISTNQSKNNLDINI